MILGRTISLNTGLISRSLGSNVRRNADALFRSSSLGEETFKRYKHLIVEANNLPFIRTSGSKRVIASAQSWTKGGSHVLHIFRQLG